MTTGTTHEIPVD